MGLGEALAKRSAGVPPPSPDAEPDDEGSESADSDDEAYSVGGASLMDAIKSGDEVAVGRAVKMLVDRCLADRGKK